jgi:predicted TIM-barrel fold metal-dependent hydrolase
MVWQCPASELPFHGDHYDPLWAAAQELDMPISLHILTGPPYPFPRQLSSRIAHLAFARTVNDKLLYGANAVSGLIAGGALERFPRLKFVLVENEISWLPFVLSQYDKYWARGNLQSQMKLNPSQYFDRQIYATFFNDPPSKMLLGSWGANNMMWSNDYPHPNSTWPKSGEVIERDLGHLAESVKKRLLSENVRDLYSLPQIAEPPRAKRENAAPSLAK